MSRRSLWFVAGIGWGLLLGAAVAWGWDYRALQRVLRERARPEPCDPRVAVKRGWWR